MRTLILLTFLTMGLVACSPSDAPTTGPDTTGVVVPEQPPTVPLAAEELVGRWSNQNGDALEFQPDGTVAVSGNEPSNLGYRVLGDTLVIAEAEALLAVDTTPASARYHIASLTATELQLEPASGRFGGMYTRQGAATPDTTGTAGNSIQ